ncbi:MAG: hypothetical protein ACI35O_00425 [Bacillaceae bacterium]
MKYFHLIVVLMLLTGCAQAPIKKEEKPIVEQQNLSVKPEESASIENREEQVVEENKDEYIEQLVAENDKILGVDVKHNENLVLIMLVFDTATTDKEIKAFLNEYASKVTQTYGDVITHIQAIRDGVNVFNLVNDEIDGNGQKEHSK